MNSAGMRPKQRCSLCSNDIPLPNKMPFRFIVNWQCTGLLHPLYTTHSKYPMLWDTITDSLILSLSLLVSFKLTGAVVTNRTIDNDFGDSVTGEKPVFLPTTVRAWEGRECIGCKVQPDKALAFNGTWNTATYSPERTGPISIDLTFKGTCSCYSLSTFNICQ